MPDEDDAGRGPASTANEFSGMAGAVVQAGSIVGGVHLHPAQPGVTPPPHELPPDVHEFTDRVEHLAEMDLLLASIEARAATAAVLISAVSGTAGVGKTAFTTHWAHRVSGRFPDGQLYVNLRGYGPDAAVSSAEALTGLLRSLGVPPTDVPHDLDARAARFRSLTAGRRMLIVLDNARSAEQVRPLLPGTSSCLVVVTSRDTLPGLVSRDGARRMNLDLLPEAQALSLLRMLVGARIDEEPAAAAALVQHCARLPLALRIAAELANASPDMSLTELVSDLADEQSRLDLLDAGADPYTAVRLVLSWSYGCLDPAEARALRLLGLHPGREFDQISVAVLMETTPERARQLINALIRAHLLERIRSKRYQMHDLLRIYAADLASQEEPQEAKEAALQRLFDFFARSTSMAMDNILPQEKDRRPRVPPTGGPSLEFAGKDQAIQWLETERATLLSIAARTAATSWAAYATVLSTTLYRFLDVYGYFDDAVALHTSAVAAGKYLRDSAAQARALHNLGSVYQRLGRYQEATDNLEQALAVAQQFGVSGVAAFVLSDLGLVMLLIGKHELALRHLEQALQLFEDAQDLTGQGQVLNNMGMSFGRLNQLDESLEHIQRSLVLFQSTNDLPRQGYALNDIGVILQRLERYSEAFDHHRQALALAREVGDRALEAEALNGLGNANRVLGMIESVKDLHEQALAIAKRIGDRYEEAQACEGLAAMYEVLAQAEAARDNWHQALAIYTELGSPEDTERVNQRLAHSEGS